MKVGFLFVLSCTGIFFGCTNPCRTLEDTICADLGSDCETFRNDKGVYGSVMPDTAYYRKAEKAQCEMMLAEQNYNAYTLPSVKYRIALRKTPGLPAPNLPDPVPTDGYYSGFSSQFLYFLPILVIIGIFLYTRKFRRPGA